MFVKGIVTMMDLPSKRTAALSAAALVLLVSCAGSAGPQANAKSSPSLRTGLSGTAYIILGDRIRDFDVFKLDLASLATERITMDVLASSIASSGEHVVVSAARGESSDPSGGDRIYRLTGTGLSPFASGPLDGTGPTVSAKGLVAFSPYGEDGAMIDQIDTFDPRTSQRRTILSDPGTVWGDMDFASSDLVIVRPRGTGGDLLRVRDSGKQSVIFTSTLPLGTVRATKTQVAVLIRTPGDALPQIQILGIDGRRTGLISGWRLLDWSPDGSGLLLTRDKVLAYAPRDSLVPRILGTLDATPRSGAWLARPIQG